MPELVLASYLFVVRVPQGKREALQQYLAAEGITTMVHYPVPSHRQPAIQSYFKKFGLVAIYLSG